MSVTAGVMLRGKLGQTKVKRFWPGKAPDWAGDVDDVDEDGISGTSRAVAPEKAFLSQKLGRLAKSRVDNSEEVRAGHRSIRQAEIVSKIEEENRRQEGLDIEEEDEDVLEERRRRIRNKILSQRQQEEAALLPEEEEEEEEEEESDYETSIATVKIFFVPKSKGDTIAKRERLEAEERALEDLMKRRLEERKMETKKIVVEEIRKDERIRKNLEVEANGDVDTDDEVNGKEEYGAWKVREIARIKRVREDREAMLKEKEEIEKVRNMTEEERSEWERKNPKPAPLPKQKWRFMQKYFHKGAFFQSNDHAAIIGTDGNFNCDFSAPTGEDKMDKTVLPKVMQVKHFGRSGRTKWTHLVNEDTTDRNNRWTYNDPLWAKYNAKRMRLA